MRSEKQIAASRANGKRGGRPRDKTKTRCFECGQTLRGRKMYKLTRNVRGAYDTVSEKIIAKSEDKSALKKRAEKLNKKQDFYGAVCYLVEVAK